MMDSGIRRRNVEVNRRYEITKSSVSGLNKLNESLLIEILTRLPCRDATRFKSVCKHWNTLISSDYFITLFNHRRHESSFPAESYRLLLEFRFRYNKNCTKPDYSLVVHCGSDGAVLRKHDLDLELEVYASFGDLILCSYDQSPNSQTLYLCNPQTKQRIELPPVQLPPRLGLIHYIAGLLCVPAPCSFCHGNGGGVIGSEFKFMVVLFCRFGFGEQVTHQIKAVLFSSDEGQWRNHLVSSPQRLTHVNKDNAVAYKGKLYWLNYPYVLVYDPYDDPDRISRVIKLENNYGHPIQAPIVWSIAVFNDRLRIAYNTEQSHPKCHYVWELEDYDVGMWRLVHEVRYTDLSPREGHVLHDGNAFYWGKSKSCVWLCSLRNGVVDKDHMYTLISEYHNWPLFDINVHHIVDLLPSPLPSFEW